MLVHMVLRLRRVVFRVCNLEWAFRAGSFRVWLKCMSRSFEVSLISRILEVEFGLNFNPNSTHTLWINSQVSGSLTYQQPLSAYPLHPQSLVWVEFQPKLNPHALTYKVEFGFSFNPNSTQDTLKTLKTLSGRGGGRSKKGGDFLHRKSHCEHTTPYWLTKGSCEC